MSVRILFSHRFFWPDNVTYASLIRALGRRLASTGHSVTVFSAQPAYQQTAAQTRQPEREVLDGMAVRRISLLTEHSKDFLIRGCNAAIYSIRLFLHILFSRKYDLVIAATFPPVAAAFAACLACRIRGSRFIYHCQDIHPEVSMIIANRANPLLAIVRKIDQWTCNNASAVFVLSEDMRQTLLERPGRSKARIEIVNNFEHPEFTPPGDTNDPPPRARAETPESRSESAFQVIFTGNLGRFQSLDTVVRAASLLKDQPHIEFLFVGEGVCRQGLQELSGELACTNVRFLARQTVSATKALINASNFGLVSLIPGMHKVAYPSKTMTYLAAGCPIIVLVDPSSELSESVRSNRLGLVARESTPESLADAVREAYRDREWWWNERERVREYANDQFSESAIFTRWQQLLRSLQDRD